MVFASGTENSVKKIILNFTKFKNALNLQSGQLSQKKQQKLATEVELSVFLPAGFQPGLPSFSICSTVVRKVEKSKAGHEDLDVSTDGCHLTRQDE